MSALAKGPLTVAETEFLGQLEGTIDAGLMTFVEVGESLAAVRDNRLYRAQFDTFEIYCAERWGMTDRRARQMIDAAHVVNAIAKTGTTVPENEAQARELARLPEEQRADVWKQTIEATDGKPTAAAVRAAATDSPTDRPVDVAAPAPAPAPLVDRLGEAVDVLRATVDGVGSPPAPSAPSPLEAWSDVERELRERLRAGETVVVTLRGAHDNLIRWAESEGLYARIDRKTPWGNPFELPADGDRQTVIAKYAEHYLPHKPSLLSKVDTLRGKALGCWCAPESCHGDALKRAAER